MTWRDVTDLLVVDASAMVDLLVGSEHAAAIRSRMYDHALHAPAHLDAEVLSALGRLQRAGHLDEETVTTLISSLRSAPITRHHLPELLISAWELRHNLRLVDGFYVALAETLDALLITTDASLAKSSTVATLP